MGLLDDVFSSDAAAAFLDTDAFAESITYSPLGGTPRTIKAVVDRDPPNTPPEVSQGLTHVMRISVANHATLGILASGLDAGGDTVTLAYRRGGTARAYLLPAPHSQDAGMLEFYIGTAR